jgi:S-adenosylmethionine:tRNA ribosyltransferase-isomerase
VTVSDFDFELPEALIAQAPPVQRRASRMMVMDRASGACNIRGFAEFAELLRPDDCLVLNDTRVIPARIFGSKIPTGAAVEALLLEPAGNGNWRALLKPGKRLPPGTKVLIRDSDDACFDVQARDEHGVFEILFTADDVPALLDQCGHIPLPPYIRRQDSTEDAERYQTVYATAPGAVAAPTAGLHFDDEMLQAMAGMGVATARLTLHVGMGTFQPVSVDRLEDHVMHSERFVLTPEAAGIINDRRVAGGRIIAVGTTSVRVLESCVTDSGSVEPRSGETDIFLHPPAEPRAVDGLLTNFHLPRSTLLMLVSTFARREHVLSAYALAVRERLRFYSYGDCMVLM